MKRQVLSSALSLLLVFFGFSLPAHAGSRPNILFCIADDWGYPHAGCYGDSVVRTPNIDRLARVGVVFEQAYVSSPSCTPSRGAILTGQWHWRLGPAGNLWCVFPKELPTYTRLLSEAGYAVGYSGKGWGPGRSEEGGNPAGTRFKDFEQFLKQRPSPDEPFCFWIGTIDPHRPYKAGTGKASGLDLNAIELPACFPDNEVIRSDVADYYFEVARFDRVVGNAIESLKKRGLLKNTVVVVTGDHGMPFPRGKSNLYDLGTRVPLVVSWPGHFPGHRRVTDFVSLTDLAPTFLELAGVAVPKEMTGRSLMPQLTSSQSGRIDPQRDHVLTGKERHVPAQEAPDMGGYPCRSIRTDEYLYIRNYRPDRWPNGTPNYEKAAIPGAWYGDTDNGPTKTDIIEHRRDDKAHEMAYRLAFAKRPTEELYDLRSDPGQLRNVAGDARYAEVKKKLADQLTKELKATNDPREVGGGERFDAYPYLGGAPKHPSFEKRKGKRKTRER